MTTKLDSIAMSRLHSVMPKFAGRFYFRLTDAGNLLGEYSNTDIDVTRPESALRNDSSPKDDFAGDYVSTWFEPSNGGEVAQLKIQPKSASSTQLSLVWKDTAGKTTYEGEAFENDGLLIGNYWKANQAGAAGE